MEDVAEKGAIGLVIACGVLLYERDITEQKCDFTHRSLSLEFKAYRYLKSSSGLYIATKTRTRIRSLKAAKAPIASLCRRKCSILVLTAFWT
jgi:hypothetical protein